MAGLSRHSTRLASDEVILDQFTQWITAVVGGHWQRGEPQTGQKWVEWVLRWGRPVLPSPSSVLALCVGQPEPRAQINFLLRARVSRRLLARSKLRNQAIYHLSFPRLPTPTPKTVPIPAERVSLPSPHFLKRLCDPTCTPAASPSTRAKVAPLGTSGNWNRAYLVFPRPQHRTLALTLAPLPNHSSTASNGPLIPFAELGLSFSC